MEVKRLKRFYFKNMDTPSRLCIISPLFNLTPTPITLHSPFGSVLSHLWRVKPLYINIFPSL